MKNRLKTLARRALSRLVQVRQVRESAFRGIARRNVRFLQECDDHLICYDPSELVGDVIYRTGGFNRQASEAVVDFIRAQGALKPGGTLVEIGANIGTQTIYLDRRAGFGRIVVVEPDPHNFRLLTTNLALNGMTDRARALNCAAGERDCTLDLRRHPRNGGASTLRQAETAHFTTPQDLQILADTVAVRVAPMDRLLAEEGVASGDIALVWMDIEGFEPVALRGMTQTLSARPPLFMEYTPGWLSPAERAEVLDRIFGLYGRVFVKADGFSLTDRATVEALEAQVDLLALA